MDFSQAVRSVVVERYADFRGRSPRSEYWWFALFYIVLSLAVGVLGVLSETLGAVANLIVGLGLLIPSIAVTVRRLHDLDWSGWWFLIIFTGIGALVIFVMMFLRGTQGDNRFGPDPLGNVAERFA